MKVSTAYLLLSCLFLPTLSLAKSNGALEGDGHAGDMVRVLGINLNDPNGYAKAEILADQNDGFPRYIDNQYDAADLGRKIKNLAPEFTTGPYSHRLFFHWGFNGSPRLNAALNERINIATNSVEVKDEIWRIIVREQSYRDTMMESVVQKAAAAAPNTTCEMRSVEVNRIAAILYDTHILGDYIEHTGVETAKPLLDIDSLQNDIIESVQRIARANMESFQNGGSSQDVKAFIAEMKRQEALPADKRAEAVLLIMQLRLPAIFEKCPRIKKAFLLPDPE